MSLVRWWWNIIVSHDDNWFRSQTVWGRIWRGLPPIIVPLWTPALICILIWRWWS